MKKTSDKNDALYDYHVYTMKPGDLLLAFLIGFIGGAVVIHIFFGSAIADVVVGIAAGIAVIPIYRKIRTEMIRNALTLQFKDMLDSLNSSFAAGKVTLAAFADAEKEMALQYGADSSIHRELKIINIGLMNGKTIEELLLDLGERSGIEDIISFSNVFSIANRRGGNLKHIINETKDILTDKIEIEQDIKASVSAASNELNIMTLMPLVIVPMMSSFSEGGAGVTDILVKLAGLVMFIVAYIIGRKIVKIKL